MKNPDINEAEKNYLINYASRLKRRSCNWRWMRWLSVIYLIISIGFVLIKDRVIEEKRLLDSITVQTVNISKEAGSKEISAAMNDLFEKCHNRTSLLLTEKCIILAINILIFMGPVFFGYTVYNWNRDIRDKLMAKLVISVLESKTRNIDYES